jgi:CheY-like chemotaxis protein
MSSVEPIVIVDDDNDDLEMIETTLKELKINHPIKFFNNGKSAYDYLIDDKVVPFIIFSDINMPGMNGFQLRDKIHESDGLRAKCTPYLFVTTGCDAKFIWEAYSKNAQGYFIKPNTMKAWRDFFSLTIKYWEESKKPRA